MKIANFDFSKKCQQIAEVTEGLSGREISKIAIAWQVSFEEIAGEMVFIQVSKMDQNFFGFVPLRFVIIRTTRVTFQLNQSDEKLKAVVITNAPWSNDLCLLCVIIGQYNLDLPRLILTAAFTS